MIHGGPIRQALAFADRGRTERGPTNIYHAPIRYVAMTLPDRFEQVGIVVGSVFLVLLPTSMLGTAIFGVEPSTLQIALVWFLPGIVVGLLLATDRLPVTYDQVWAFALSSWIITLVLWSAFGLSLPPADRGLAVLLWIVALTLGATVAWVRPVRTVLRRVRSAG